MRGRRSEQARKTIGYIRVSTNEQAEVGFSIPTQRDRLTMFAQATGREPIDEFLVDDGYSATTLKRPAMSELLQRIRNREIGAVLIAKLDRLTRNLHDLTSLVKICERTDTTILSATESIDTSTAAGRMFVQALGMIAEFQSARIGENTSEVLGHRRRNSKVYCATAPFGYRRDGDSLIAVPNEQDALAEMRGMHDAGKSYREIGEMLDSRGIKPRGKRWYPASVRAVLVSKMTMEAFAA